MKHLESKIQICCVEWFNLQFSDLIGHLYAVPNGGKRNALEAAIMKREGIVSGVSDLVLSYPSGGYHGLFVEMKTKSGKQSDKQKDWQSKMERVGYKYTVCHSVEEFQVEIVRYMTAQPKQIEIDTALIERVKQKASKFLLWINKLKV